MLPGLINSFALARSGARRRRPGRFARGAADGAGAVLRLRQLVLLRVRAPGLAVRVGTRCHAEPKALVTNEFYELENLKFSTSLKHAIWVGDFLERYDADLVRLYLAYTNPELQRTSFVEAQMRAWLSENVLGPGSASAARRAAASTTRRRGAASKRIPRGSRAYYGVERFSLREAARVIVQALGWLSLADAAPSPAVLSAFAAFCSPIMPRFAAELAASLGLSGVPAMGRALFPARGRARARCPPCRSTRTSALLAGVVGERRRRDGAAVLPRGARTGRGRRLAPGNQRHRAASEACWSSSPARSPSCAFPARRRRASRTGARPSIVPTRSRSC